MLKDNYSTATSAYSQFPISMGEWKSLAQTFQVHSHKTWLIAEKKNGVGVGSQDTYFQFQHLYEILQ